MRAMLHNTLNGRLCFKRDEPKAAVLGLVVLGLGKVDVHHITESAEVLLDVRLKGVFSQLPDEDARARSGRGDDERVQAQGTCNRRGSTNQSKGTPPRGAPHTLR